MKNLLSLLLLLCLAPLAYAGPFDPPPTDQSVNVLGIIFGSNIGTIPLGGSPNPVLSDLMEKFNFIIVVVGLFVVSYVGIISVINTASEGAAMGKKWSAIWVPMRSIAGMALLVPAPASGYSMIQVTVMWIILQGIGAADALWEVALDGLASGASVSGGTKITDAKLFTEGQALAAKLLNAQICMQTLRAQALSDANAQANGGTGTWLNQNGQLINDFVLVNTGQPFYAVSGAKDTAASSKDPSCKTDLNNPVVQYAEMRGRVYFGVDNGSNGEDSERHICGVVDVVGSVCSTEFKDSSTASPSDSEMLDAAQEIYFTKLNVISSMLTTLQGLSDGLVSGAYIQPFNTSDPQTKIPPTGYIDAAAKQYQNMLSSLVIVPAGGSQFATNTPTSNLSPQLKEQIKEGKQNGWISAGSYYFVFNQTAAGKLFKSAASGSKDIFTDNDTIPSCKGTECSTGFPSENETAISNLVNLVSIKEDRDILAKNLAMGDQYYQKAIQSAGSIINAPGDSSGAINLSAGTLTNANSIAMQQMVDMLNTDDPNIDPLMALATFGGNLMKIVEDTVFGVLGMLMVLSAGSLFAYDTIRIWGTSIHLGLASGLARIASGILVLFGIFVPVLAAMWVFGALLGVYCPLIPFMIFIMTAVGWFLTVIEAIMAAPIVALGFILPNGDDLGKIEHALSILANIFLRPMLMLLGFILASRVFKAIVTFINFGMGSVFETINVNSIFSSLVVMGVYTFFIIGVINTSFSLIYALPDKVLRWIGGSPEQTDTGALGEAKSGGQNMAQLAGRGLQDMGAKAGKKLSPILSSKINKSAGDSKDEGK